MWNSGIRISQYDVDDRLDSIVPGNTDGAIIATPANTHKDITKLLLRKEIDVETVEKKSNKSIIYIAIAVLVVIVLIFMNE